MHHNKRDFYDKCISFYCFKDETSSNIRLEKSTFNNCVFKDLVLDKVDLTDAKFVFCSFENVKINRPIAINATEFVKCVFINCTIKEMSLTGLAFKNCSFICGE